MGFFNFYKNIKLRFNPEESDGETKRKLEALKFATEEPDQTFAVTGGGKSVAQTTPSSVAKKEEVKEEPKKEEGTTFRVKAGSDAEKRIKEIVKEEEARNIQKFTQDDKFALFGRSGPEQEFKVGEGVEDKPTLLPPGPTRASRDLPADEPREIIQPTKDGINIPMIPSPKETARLAILLQVEKARREESFLDPAEFGPGELKKFAWLGLAEEAAGGTLTKEEKQLQRAGMQEMGMEVFGFTQPMKISQKGIDKTTNKLINDMGRKIVSQKFRADKLNLPEKSILDIEGKLSALGLKTRTVRTFGDMEKAALELSVAPEVLLRESITNRITDKEVIALRNLINSNSQFITNSEKKIVANPDLARTLEPKIALAEQQVNDALKKIIKGGTEAGRSVVAFRKMANNSLDADVWLRKAQKEFGKGQLPDDVQRAIRSLINKKDVNGLAEFVSMLRTPSNVEKAVTLWKAGLLTSPTTQLANLGGNVTMKGLMTLSDVPATGLDMLASVFTGKRTQHISSKTIFGAVKGGLKGVKNAKEFLRTGIYSDELLTKYDIPKNVKFKNKILDVYTKSIFRSLGANDILFRQAAMQESLEKNAWLIAKNEQLSGQAFKARVSSLLKKPTNEMVVSAVEAAEYATFQSPNVLSDLISGAKGKVAGRIKSAELAGKSTLGKKATLAATEIIAPFTKTPTNIAARLADYSPLGFFKAMTRLIKPQTSRQAETIDAFSKALTGTGVMWLGSYLASRGKMTGNIPTNANERADFYAEGKQPNSIRIGDNWYQLNRVSPFGNLLALGAEFHEISEEEEEPSRIAVRLGFEGIKGLTEQTFLKGVSGALGALTEPERKAEKFAQQTVASTVPSIIGKIGKAIDPTLKLTDSIPQSVQERIPGWRSKLPVRRDIFGEQVKVPGGKLSIVDPFSTKKAVDSPILNEAKRLDITIGMPSTTISGIKLTGGEISEYQKFNGQILKQTLDAIIDSNGYEELADPDKRKVIEDTVTIVRRTTNDSVFPALMIIRWNLPQDTNPEFLRDTLSVINNSPEYKDLSDEKKGDVVRQILEQL